MAHEWFQQKAPRERLLELRKHALRAPITYRLICKYEGYAAGSAAYRAQAAAALKVISGRRCGRRTRSTRTRRRGEVVVWRKEPLPDGDGAADAIDEAWRATRKRYPVPPRRSPPIGIEMGGAELKGAAADYLGVYRLVEGLRINDRPAWRHSVRTDRWLAYDGWDAWMCQPECVLGESKGELQLIAPQESAGAESPERAADGGVWSAAVDGGWLDEPTLRCRPLCTYEDLDAAERRAQAVAAARDVRARLDGRHPDLGAPSSAAPSPS